MSVEADANKNMEEGDLSSLKKMMKASIYAERQTREKQNVIRTAVDFVLNPKQGQPSDLRGVSDLFGVPYSTLRDNYFKAQGKEVSKSARNKRKDINEMEDKSVIKKTTDWSPPPLTNTQEHPPATGIPTTLKRFTEAQPAAPMTATTSSTPGVHTSYTHKLVSGSVIDPSIFSTIAPPLGPSPYDSDSSDSNYVSDSD